MKKVTLRKIANLMSVLAILILGFANLSTAYACDENHNGSGCGSCSANDLTRVSNISQTSTNSTTNATTVAQSFNSNVNGWMSSVEVYNASTVSVACSLKVYSGNGTTSGTPLYQAALTIPSGGSTGSWYSISLPYPTNGVWLTDGNYYTVVLTKTSTASLKLKYSTSCYFNGTLKIDNSTYSTRDLGFKVWSYTDQAAPTVHLQNITAYLGSNGYVTVEPKDFDNGTTDNCCIDWDNSTMRIGCYTNESFTFDCGDKGTKTVYVTVKDGNGNTASTVTVTLTIADNTRPTITCPSNITVNLSSSDEVYDRYGRHHRRENRCSYDRYNRSYSNCYHDEDEHEDDDHGDHHDCDNDESHDGTQTTCGTRVEFTVRGSDNCSGLHITSNPPSGHIFPVGTTTVYSTATDASGLTSTCSFTVTVRSTIAPVPDVSSLPTITGNCSVSLTAPTAKDYCGNTITGTTTNPTTYTTAGTYTVTWTYNNGFGYTTTQTQRVVVNGSGGAPVANVSQLPAVSGNCSVTLTAPTAHDACSNATITGTTSNTTFSNPGTYTVTWTYTNGNASSTQTQSVTVIDNTAPVAPALADLIGECSATASVPTANDDCVGSVRGTTSDALTYTAQGTHYIHWSFSDGHGNTSTATQTVIIRDVTAPVVPTLATVNGECFVSVSTPTTSDNCNSFIAGTTIDPVTYNTPGNYTIHWAFDDGNHNISYANQSVNVTDVTAPVAPSIATVSGECSATVTSAPVANDACAGNITGTTTDPLTYTEQGSHTIQWTFNDGHGNISHANQTVIVHDATAPVAPTLADVTGECTATATVPTATDNCVGTVTGTTNDALTYNTPGTHPIHWSFTDGNGNTSTATQNVIIHDVTAPVAPTLADLTGECTATATVPTATDNCVGTVNGTTSDALTYNTPGTHPIHWSFTDGHGNTSTATQNVIIHDVTAPVAPALADVTGECTATATIPTATDNCAGPVNGTTSDVLTYTQQGTHTIHWSFTDGHGNTSTATQNVIIHDVTAPVAPTLADVTAQCSAHVNAPTAQDACTGTIAGTTSDPVTYTEQGDYTITWSFDDGNGNVSTSTQAVHVHATDPINVPTLSAIHNECSVYAPPPANAPTATDACGNTLYGYTESPISTWTAIGTYTIVWNFDDNYGHHATADQLYIVEDTQAPSVGNLPDATAECSITVTAPTASDDCAGTITGTTTQPLTYTGVGSHVITWTFDDGHGNTVTRDQNVIVDDLTAPDVPTLADVTGTCSATATAPTTTDNCAGTITGTTSDPLTYNTAGTHVIHWSFSDGHGNTSNTEQNVIVTSNAGIEFSNCPSTIHNCSNTATWTAPTASNLCGGGSITMTSSHNPGDYFGNGTTTVTYTANNGTTTATCSFDVVIGSPSATVNAGCTSFSVDISNGSTPYTMVYSLGSTTNTVNNYYSGTSIDYTTSGNLTVTSIVDNNSCTASIATHNYHVNFVNVVLKSRTASTSTVCSGAITSGVTYSFRSANGNGNSCPNYTTMSTSGASCGNANYLLDGSYDFKLEYAGGYTVKTINSLSTNTAVQVKLGQVSLNLNVYKPSTNTTVAYNGTLGTAYGWYAVSSDGGSSWTWYPNTPNANYNNGTALSTSAGSVSFNLLPQDASTNDYKYNVAYIPNSGTTQAVEKSTYSTSGLLTEGGSKSITWTYTSANVLTKEVVEFEPFAVVGSDEVNVYPNPFTSGTNIEIGIMNTGNVSVSVMNALGQPVKQLFNSGYNAGTMRIEWDGKGNDGLRLPNGVYYLNVTTGTSIKTVPVTIMN